MIDNLKVDCLFVLGILCYCDLVVILCVVVVMVVLLDMIVMVEGVEMLE